MTLPDRSPPYSICCQTFSNSSLRFFSVSPWLSYGCVLSWLEFSNNTSDIFSTHPWDPSELSNILKTVWYFWNACLIQKIPDKTWIAQVIIVKFCRQTKRSNFHTGLGQRGVWRRWCEDSDGPGSRPTLSIVHLL